MIPVYNKTDVILDVKDLSLTLDGNLILKDVNFTIRDIIRPGMIQGQVTAILAKSGAGKSQFMKCISGLYSPIDDAPEKKGYAVMTGLVQLGNPLKPVVLGEAGLVQQNYIVFDNRTVMDNLMIAGRNLDKKERKEKAEFYLNEFELSDKKDLYPIQLSGGQKQRVAIIRQLISSKHLIIMDEPTSGLDPQSTNKLVDNIIKISCLDELNTILIVTHDIPTACAVADDVIIMGRDKDVNGNYIPGTSIKKEYNLIEEGLAWQQNIRNLPQFSAMVNEIRNEFINW